MVIMFCSILMLINVYNSSVPAHVKMVIRPGGFTAIVRGKAKSYLTVNVIYPYDPYLTDCAIRTFDVVSIKYVV